MGNEELEADAYTLGWGRWGPPLGGRYHTERCQAVKVSDRELLELAPEHYTLEELEEDDDWEECGHCASEMGVANRGGDWSHQKALKAAAKAAEEENNA